MYSKKYIAKSVTSSHRSECHNEVEGAICFPAYFKVGERGWFLFRHEEDFFNPYHRLHTSEVKAVEYGNNYIKVTTQNTEYLFEVIENEE